MHLAALKYVATQVNELNLHGDILDLGGRDVNGTVHDLFPDSTWTVVDIAAHPSVDVVGDAAIVDLDKLFDIVVSTECFEHTSGSPKIIANAWRHLRSGGILVATMAGPGRAPHSATGAPFLPPGEWYRNVEPAELAGWLRDAGFERCEINQTTEDLRCVAWKG